MATERRLIDANALRDDTYILDSWDAKIVRAWLDDQPTVDAATVAHGRWIPAGVTEDLAKCSVCGKMNHSLDYVYRLRYNYCPDCGAKMDGGNEDD